jgi:hypothetical protein
MSAIPTASSDMKSDKKVKSELKASQLDMVSSAVSLKNMQETINFLINIFEKLIIPP